MYCNLSCLCFALHCAGTARHSTSRVACHHIATRRPDFSVPVSPCKIGMSTVGSFLNCNGRCREFRKAAEHKKSCIVRFLWKVQYPYNMRSIMLGFMLVQLLLLFVNLADIGTSHMVIKLISAYYYYYCCYSCCKTCHPISQNPLCLLRTALESSHELRSSTTV